MVLTAETDPAKPIPRPRSTALSLKKLALTTIRDWAKDYGSGYKKLHLGISFLKNCKKVDLNAMALEEAAEVSRQRELKRRKVQLQNERFKKVVEELNGNLCITHYACGYAPVLHVFWHSDFNVFFLFQTNSLILSMH